MGRFELEDGRCVDDCLIARALAGLCVGLVLTNSSGRVIWLNVAAQRVLGLSATPWRGRPFNRLLKDLHLASFWHEAGEVDGNVLGEVRVDWPEKLSLKVNATRYVDSSGHEIGRALLFCDVTAEHAVQVELSREVVSRLLDLTNKAGTNEPPAGLTQQELRILRMVGQGLTNQEIADKACISPATVRSHLKNLYRKVGLGSRAEAVSYAVRSHLV